MSRPTARPWTTGERFLVRLGLTCILFGALGHILPLFGLQLRKLSRAGDNTGAVATGILIVGAVMCGIALLRRTAGLRAAKHVLLGIVGIVVAGIVGLFVMGYLMTHRGRPATAPPPFVSPQPGVPLRPPGIGAPPPRPTFESLVERYGAGRVARIVGEGPGAVAAHDRVRERLRSAQGKGGTWTISKSADHFDALFAPVGDLDAFAKQLSAGEAEINIDPGTSTIRLTFKLVLPPTTR